MLSGEKFLVATKGLPKSEMIFVETGSYMGDQIEMALELGFSQIRSVEITSKYYNHCRERFSKEVLSGKVKLYHGDSANLLADMIGKTKKRIVFWLDAHCSDGETGGDDNSNPLMNEIRAIKNTSSRNDHVIMVDDLRFIRQGKYKDNGQIFTEAALNDLIMSINPKYKFKYVDLETAAVDGWGVPLSQVYTIRDEHTGEISRKLIRKYCVERNDILIARDDWK